MKRWGIVKLYMGRSGRSGFYNSQETGLARAMKKLGYDCYIFEPAKETGLREEKPEEGITIVHVPARSIGINAGYDWSVLIKYRIDIAQINADNRIYAYDVIKYCDRNGIFCYTYSGIFESDSRSFVKRLLMHIAMKRNIRAMQGHKNFVKTGHLAERAKIMGISNVETAYVGLDTSIIPDKDEELILDREEYNIPRDKKILLFVGRTDAYKRPMDALDILEELDDTYHLVVIGSGKMDDRFDGEIKRRDLTDRITRIKKIENQKIHKFYKAAEYMLNFNPDEIFGMSILEAMYQGCSVIARHAPGPDEIIEDGISGFLVSDIREMVSLIRTRKKVSAEDTKRRITENFSWEKTADKIDKARGK